MNNIYKVAKLFSIKLAERQKGRSLPETGYKEKYVRIYRAVPININTFSPMDYVATAFLFAKKHAEHGAAIDDEPHHVISILAKASNIYEAYNPHEYFYDGPPVAGRVYFVAKP